MPRKGENIYKRKDGRWEGRFPATNVNGEKKYTSVYGYSYTEVRKKLLDRRSEGYPSTNITFETTAREWLCNAKIRVKESSYANYTYLLKRHILPTLGKKKMNDLSTSDINRFIREKTENGRLKRKGGISRKYLQDIVSVVKSVASFCEQEHGIPDKIRHIHPPKPEKQERPVLSEAEQNILTKKLLNHVSQVNLGILLALYSGLRIGEVCGLRWEDYDAENGILYVRRTVQRIPDNNGGTMLHVGTPKTQSSVRAVPLPLKLCKLMSKLKGKDDEYIISSSATVPEPSQLRKSFKKLLRESGLTEIRFHDLRHIFASNCVRMNFDVKSLSEILGHSNVAMTLNRYVHTSMATKRNLMNMIRI